MLLPRSENFNHLNGSVDNWKNVCLTFVPNYQFRLLLSDQANREFEFFFLIFKIENRSGMSTKSDVRIFRESSVFFYQRERSRRRRKGKKNFFFLSAEQKKWQSHEKCDLERNIHIFFINGSEKTENEREKLVAEVWRIDRSWSISLRREITVIKNVGFKVLLSFLMDR